MAEAPRLRLRVKPPQVEPFERDCAGPVVVLGRSSKADVAIPDPFLSRLHARLVREDEGWFLEDLGSRNPTQVNGRAIAGRTRLASGDEIRLGGTLVIAFDAAEAEREPDFQPESSVFRPASAFLAPADSHLKLLNEVHRALAAPISLEALLDLILDRAFAHLRPEEATIFLKKPDGEIYRAASRRLPDLTGDYLYSRRLLKEVMEKGLAALVFDVAHDERFSTAESIVSSGVRSLLAAPLLDSEGCPGMIVLASRVHVRRFAEEDMELLCSLASAAAMRIRNLALTEEAARRQVLEKELELAAAIQMGMLPKRFPDRPEFELAAALKPARSVGGDLYDFLSGERALWFLVGDVSGKGVGAALFMAVTKTLFHAIVQAEATAASVLDRMNRELARDNEQAMFVTAFAGRLDLQTGLLEFANAGHNPPYWIGSGGEIRAVTGALGIPLGTFEDYSYSTGQLQLQPGDRLLLYTDGVVEALDAAGQQFSEGKLKDVLRAAAGGPAAEMVKATIAAVDAFAGATDQFDDITVLAIRYLGEA